MCVCVCVCVCAALGLHGAPIEACQSFRETEDEASRYFHEIVNESIDESCRACPHSFPMAFTPGPSRVLPLLSGPQAGGGPRSRER